VSGHPLKLAAASSLLALLLAGCNPFSAPDEAARVKKVVTAVFTRDDPATCTDLVTANFLQATYGANPELAADACLRSQGRGGKTAQSVVFASVRIDGGHAVATLKVVGGPLDGRTVIAGLVQQYGWRLDSLRQPKPPPTPRQLRHTADMALRKGLIESQGFKPKRADCFVRYVRKHVSDAQLASDLQALHAGQTPGDFLRAARQCKR
jgi:hypothetical protein